MQQSEGIMCHSFNTTKDSDSQTGLMLHSWKLFCILWFTYNTKKVFVSELCWVCPDFEVPDCAPWLLLKPSMCHLNVRVRKHMSGCVPRLRVHCTHLCMHVSVSVCVYVHMCILSLVYFGVIFDKPLSDVARWSDSLSESGSRCSHCGGGPLRSCTGYN